MTAECAPGPGETAAGAGSGPESAPAGARSGDAAAEHAARECLRDLAHEDLVLLDVRDQLYGGDWGELQADLKARLENKPHIFRLITKIEEDLARLERLRSFEAARGVDLGTVRRRVLEEQERAAEKQEKHGAHEAGEARSGGPTG